ncbi:response regulator [Plebeiibacterium marinum]|uniref:Response regulator n=1 Tax=Plebeiibacterium marinum TaxID=2992111 RepID=A0AAE3SL29_9BACT|nr:response regulator [Plebeiobacterium marinum]MCW3806994.1 response regulator [Plebeiobacterium marinum]
MNPLNILLVEDNVLNQKLIFLNLSKFGHQIDVADNGKVAVDKVKNNKYDIVIMDLMMPVMDGIEATRNIREWEKDKTFKTCIIGLTANTFDADRDKCLANGMDEYMAKPFNLKLFDNLLRELDIVK